MFFCSLSNRVVVYPPMTSYVLSENHFANVDRLVRKTFYFCKFGDIHVEKENKKSESTRDQYENARSHLG